MDGDLKLTKKVIKQLLTAIYSSNSVDALGILYQVCKIIKNDVTLDKHTKTDILWEITDCYYKMFTNDFEDIGGYDE